MNKKIDVYGVVANTQNREYLYSTNKFRLCREAVDEAYQMHNSFKSLTVGGGRTIQMGLYCKFSANFSRR